MCVSEWCVGQSMRMSVQSKQRKCEAKNACEVTGEGKDECDKKIESGILHIYRICVHGDLSTNLLNIDITIYAHTKLNTSIN